MRTCKICKSEIAGRDDKVFGSSACKNECHVKLRRVTNQATRKTDDILRRNRSILLELKGKSASQKKY